MLFIWSRLRRLFIWYENYSKPHLIWSQIINTKVFRWLLHSLALVFIHSFNMYEFVLDVLLAHMCCGCVVAFVSTVLQRNRPYIRMYPRLPGVPSRSGHYIALNRAPCAIPGVLISYPLYTASMASKCQSPSPSSSYHLPSPWHPYFCFLCLYFCFANMIIYTIFPDFYMH